MKCCRCAYVCFQCMPRMSSFSLFFLSIIDEASKSYIVKCSRCGIINWNGIEMMRFQNECTIQCDYVPMYVWCFRGFFAPAAWLPGVFHQQSGIKPNILFMERIISNSKTKRLIDKSWIEKIGTWERKTTKHKRRFECECKLETPCSNTLKSNL